MLPLFHSDFLADVTKSGSSWILLTRYPNLVSDGYRKLIEDLLLLSSFITPHGQHVLNIHSIKYKNVKTNTGYETMKNNRQVLLLKCLKV